MGWTYWIAPQRTGGQPAPAVGRAPGHLFLAAAHTTGAGLARVGRAGAVAVPLWGKASGRGRGATNRLWRVFSFVCLAISRLSDSLTRVAIEGEVECGKVLAEDTQRAQSGMQLTCG